MTKRSASEELAVQVLRRRAREVAFQVLYQDDLNPGVSPAVGEEFVRRELGDQAILQFAQEELEEFLREGFRDHPMAEQVELIRAELQRFVREGFSQWRKEQMLDLARRLVAGVRRHRTEIDAALARVAHHWALERMAPTDRNVLRLGAYELLYESTPDPVVLDEAIELARRFGGAKSPSFVNGILDRLRREYISAADPRRSTDSLKPENNSVANPRSSAQTEPNNSLPT
ncbi:MAG: transcription antitermination factor NusB [Thermoguttaceae bacterium]|nr:transcription antitermination factor NusB [Thermoguttaceae bacterium]MDW8037372.1 transcription antitermination factor NusB [Thermoguttaceae bacterium]